MEWQIKIMSSQTNVLLVSGLLVLAAAILHVAILLGGPAWYEFFRAPPRIVMMARQGGLRAPISCLVIAAILLGFSCYAFSALGWIRELPLLKPGLDLIGAAFLLRGLLLIPLVAWQPAWLLKICNCPQIDAFQIVTSIICLFIGVGYVWGARSA
jgi:putative oxidoreductase